MTRKKNAVPRWCLAALLAALCAGCAGTAKQQDLPPEEIVRLRAQAWADALLAGDLEGAYALTSPNFRQFSSAALYSTFVAGRSTWNSAVAEHVRCKSEDVCDVQVTVEYTVRSMNVTSRRGLPYTWTRVDGQWWLYVPAK